MFFQTLSKTWWGAGGGQSWQNPALANEMASQTLARSNRSESTQTSLEMNPLPVKNAPHLWTTQDLLGTSLPNPDTIPVLYSGKNSLFFASLARVTSSGHN